MLERGGGAHHLIETFRLEAFWLRRIFRRGGRDPSRQMRFEHPPDCLVLFFGQTTNDPAPHDPEFIPNRRLAMERDTFREQLKGLFAAPFVQRVAESWTQSVPDEAIENSLVHRGSPAFFRAGEQGAPQLAQ